MVSFHVPIAIAVGILNSRPAIFSTALGGFFSRLIDYTRFRTHGRAIRKPESVYAISA